MRAVRFAGLLAIACRMSVAAGAFAQPATAPAPAPPAPAPPAPEPIAPEPIAPAPVGPDTSSEAASLAAPPAPVAPAAPPMASAEASRVDAARRLGAQGLAAFDEHAYLTAIERLTEALGFHDAPTLRSYRARAFGRLGRWVAACEDYDAILRSQAEASESPVVAQAREGASQEGKEACGRIAKLRLVDLAGDAVVVRLDGSVWPSKQLDRVRYLDPGPHAIERVAPRQRARRRVLSIAAGETLTVSLRSLEPVAHASVDAELLRFLGERQRPPAGELDPAPVGERDTVISGRESAAKARARDRFRLEAQPLGSMYHHVDFSAPAFDSFEQDSVGLAGRLALEWSPLPERVRDWFGVGASWVQDFDTSRFHYSQALGFVSSHYTLGRWRFGARLGLGFLEAGVELLDQRFALVEPALDASARFGELTIDTTWAFIAPVGYADHSVYSNLSGYGLEGRVTLDYRVWRWLGVQLSAALGRFDYHLESPDIILLDGAAPPNEMTVLDLYTSGFLGLSASL